jgi:hypothetical protein
MIWGGGGEGEGRSGFDAPDVGGLRALGTLHEIEGHRVASGETAKAASLNSTEVHKDVGAILSGDEPKTFCVIEPLDDASFHVSTC